MPIVDAFTLTGALAVIVNGWFFVRALRRQRDQKRQPPTSDTAELEDIARTFVQVWGAILFADLLLFIAGVGLIVGQRPFGYLIAAVPLASTAVGFFALRGF